MSAWSVWCGAVEKLRPAFSRRATFLWLLAATAAFAIREDLNGVTSFVRVLELDPRLYHSPPVMFHSSAVDSDTDIRPDRTGDRTPEKPAPEKRNACRSRDKRESGCCQHGDGKTTLHSRQGNVRLLSTGRLLRFSVAHLSPSHLPQLPQGGDQRYGVQENTA